jgi:hypothetical protein
MGSVSHGSATRPSHPVVPRVLCMQGGVPDSDLESTSRRDAAPHLFRLAQYVRHRMGLPRDRQYIPHVTLAVQQWHRAVSRRRYHCTSTRQPHYFYSARVSWFHARATPPSSDQQIHFGDWNVRREHHSRQFALTARSSPSSCLVCSQQELQTSQTQIIAHRS